VLLILLRRENMPTVTLELHNSILIGGLLALKRIHVCMNYFDDWYNDVCRSVALRARKKGADTDGI